MITIYKANENNFNNNGLGVLLPTEAMVIEKTVTKVKPEGSDDEGNPLFLPEIYIDSPRINNYAFPLVSVMKFNDIRVGDEMPFPTAYEEMRKRVNDYYIGGGDLPTVNAKVDFILLRQTEAYKEFAPLEEIYLGDTISVIHEGLNITLKSKCIKYTYDSILERYEQIELGVFRDDI